MDFILQHRSAHMFSSFFLQIHGLYVFWMWYCAEITSFPLLLIKPKFCEENLRYIRILANHKLVFHLTTPESDISIVRMMMIIDHSLSTHSNTWVRVTDKLITVRFDNIEWRENYFWVWCRCWATVSWYFLYASQWFSGYFCFCAKRLMLSLVLLHCLKMST